MKLVIAFIFLTLAIKLVATTPRPVPVINLDSNPHSITMQIYCDGDRIASIETYVDGAYVMTTVLPPPAPFNLRLSQ